MKKSEVYGLTGSIIITGILILLLFLIVMPGLKQPEDEGIMVSFGEVDMGAGNTQTPTTEPVIKETTPPPAAPKPVKQEVLTQDDNSLAIAEQKKKDRQEKEAIDRQRQKEIQQAKEKQILENKSKEIENSMKNTFGSGNSKGSGKDTGDGRQGNPVGSGNSNGNAWNLEGRELIGGIVKPRYESSTIGQITVQIKVDVNGKVFDVSIHKPTNIGDSDIRKDAIKAAYKVKFSPGENIQYGTITYNYINN